MKPMDGFCLVDEAISTSQVLIILIGIAWILSSELLANYGRTFALRCAPGSSKLRTIDKHCTALSWHARHAYNSHRFCGGIFFVWPRFGERFLLAVSVISESNPHLPNPSHKRRYLRLHVVELLKRSVTFKR